MKSIRVRNSPFNVSDVGQQQTAHVSAIQIPELSLAHWMVRFAGLMEPHYPYDADFSTFRTYFHQYCEGSELTRDDKRNFTEAMKRLRNYVLSHADAVPATLSCTGKEFL